MSNTIRQSSKSPVLVKEGGDDISRDAESGREMMQAVLSKPRKPAKFESSDDNRISGVVIGTLSGAGENGQTMVHFPGIHLDEPIEAISTENMADQSPGSEIALGFVDGNPAHPIILGLIQKTGNQTHSLAQEPSNKQDVNVRLDGEKLTLSADREIVLKCGKSSITLTRAGKIIVKGAYLSNHSTGVNRIKGGSVQIN